jgi:hypothetical protein
MQRGVEIHHGDAQTWAARIAERWRASVESIIETGRLLLEAKATLQHGEFGMMCESQLPFSARTAQRLIAIAQDNRLSNINATRASLLPASWNSLYELTRLSDDEFEAAIKDRNTWEGMERKEVALIRAPNATPTDTGEPPDIRRLSSAERDPDREAEFTGGSPVSASMPGGGLAIAHRRVERDDSRDFFPTPPWATRALIERVFRHLGWERRCKKQKAWEPACGEGHMAEVLREYFLEVTATDIEDYRYGDHVVDFLNADAYGAFDWVITNPPFNDSAEFVLKALRIARTGVAMFVRLAWLESVGRYETIFRDHAPTQLAIFAERVPLHKDQWKPDGDTLTAYIWLVWHKGIAPRAPFWIPPGCRDQLTWPDDVDRFTKSPVVKRVKMARVSS